MKIVIKKEDLLPELFTHRGRSKLWSPSYYVGTAGDVSAETIKRYIEECQDA